LTNSNQYRTASTYSLLVQSEEKERSLSETFIYILLIGAGVFSIWQAALQPRTLRVNTAPAIPAAIAQAATAEQPQV
jgi:hypothetical protein